MLLSLKQNFKSTLVFYILIVIDILMKVHPTGIDLVADWLSVFGSCLHDFLFIFLDKVHL